MTALTSDQAPEAIRRDQQAAGYLEHSKFPVQIDRLKRFIATVPRNGLAYDLGCGPGPTTRMLLDHGLDVIGVDFSRASLAINRQTCPEATFVQADLRAVDLEPLSVDGLMMADFLQHLPSAEDREAFLANAFAALKPGGWFYLSFFNVNVVNWIKGDIHGSFAEGTIRYSRLAPAEVLKSLPQNIRVGRVRGMNISHVPAIDRLITSLPVSHYLARMVVITGCAASSR